MKLGLSLLAIGATATHISAGDDCLSDWMWEDCSQLWFQWDWCAWEDGYLGWWYWLYSRRRNHQQYHQR